MDTSLIILDDVLDNAAEVRAAALGLNYPQPEAATYFPGRNSERRVTIAGLDEAVSRILGEPLVPTEGTAHGKFRIATAGETGMGGVHIDPNHWSGVLYLSRPEDCQGGTDFFRHRRTGTDRAPVYPEDLKAMGLSHPSEVWDKVINPDTNDPSKWERILQAPMRFNRLILFRPWQWHNATPGFGDRPENARLVYLLFYSQRR